MRLPIEECLAIVAGDQTQLRIVAGRRHRLDSLSGNHRRIVITTSGRKSLNSKPLFQTGRVYPIHPRHRKHPLYHARGGEVILAPRAAYAKAAGIEDGATLDTAIPWGLVKEWLHETGYYPARFLVTAIRQEPLQNITMHDAQAHGFTIPGDFRSWWQQCHYTSGERWADNPSVFVIGLELMPAGLPQLRLEGF